MLRENYLSFHVYFFFVVDMTTATVDDRGRIYLPKDAREEHGQKYRIVKLKNGIKLIPLADDPVEGLREAVGGKMNDLEMEEIDQVVEEEMRKEVFDE